MAKNLDALTESDFQACERVRVRGKYNMFDSRSRAASGLDKETYLGVLKHYTALMERFPNVARKATSSRKTRIYSEEIPLKTRLLF